MDKFELVDRLKNKANISYEEANNALEINNWDMLDAMLYLEECGKINRPVVSIFYTNENKEDYSENQEITNVSNNKNHDNSKTKNSFESVFEAICKFIDTCNNIFIEIKRKNKLLLKLPLSVMILLGFLSFGIIIPILIITLFSDMEYSISAKNINVDKVNRVLSDISETVKGVKERINRRDKND